MFKKKKEKPNSFTLWTFECENADVFRAGFDTPALVSHLKGIIYVLFK